MRPNAVYQAGMLNWLFPGYLLLILCSCSVSRQISNRVNEEFLKDSAAGTGHIGISIYEPATKQYWYNYNATKYFVPASNTKLFTLYAGMKYVGDSIPAFRYEVQDDSTLLLQPTGDPTFLHPGFSLQPAYDLLHRYKKIVFTHPQFTDDFLGPGWAWDDYLETYMAQRSNFPVYANLVNIKKIADSFYCIPKSLPYSLSPAARFDSGFVVSKKWEDNSMLLSPGTEQAVSLPFTPLSADIIQMLADTLHNTVVPGTSHLFQLKNVFYSRGSDSVFRPMMYESDNFFAEQILLMAAFKFLGYMNDERMIDTLLKTDLQDIPQKPSWVDGSGLSRYNLFTPQSMVYILDKLKNEFGMERMESILPTGGKGTLSTYYRNQAGFIFAKTGTLSNHCALSGYLITRKNKLLIFSILVNNFHSPAPPVRRAIERFLTGLRNKY
jgi:D-alanyl-D-alanine carboxypeptidase/D-alanyl-D-alanine-endopeptidase (penicillin-binding protein 4)